MSSSPISSSSSRYHKVKKKEVSERNCEHLRGGLRDCNSVRDVILVGNDPDSR